MGLTVIRAITLSSTLFYVCLQTADAQDSVTYGNWLVGVQEGNTGLFAATVNDSGLAMGEYCSDKPKANCIWLVAADLNCDQGAKYPALGNTDGGEFSLELVCGSNKVNNRSVYIFTDWSQLESAIKKSKQIGIAVPMPGNRFEVWKFSLNGMVDATRAMERAFLSRSGGRNGSTSTATEQL